MKYSGLLFVCVLLVITGCSRDTSEEISRLKQEIEDLKALSGPPPSSLNSLYPPEVEAPLYLLKMLEMSPLLAGVAIDMSEQDLENARSNFEAFKTRYEAISVLVPEWKKRYPIEPVEELGRALETGEQAGVMAALEEIDKVCYDCHVVNMTKVQQRYHWGDFSALTLTDPVTEEEASFFEYMWYLERPFVGVMVDLEQGQTENAMRQFNMFNERIQELREACTSCHDTEREYFVGQDVQRLINRVGATLEETSPDPELIAGLMQRIGMESCFRCHLVHLPAAHNNIRWRESNKVNVE